MKPVYRSARPTTARVLASVIFWSLLALVPIQYARSTDIMGAAVLQYDLVEENGLLVLGSKKLSSLSSIGMVIDVPVNDQWSAFFQPAVKFESVDLGKAVGAYNKNIHWDANFLAAYHLLGHQSVFDPYLTTGIGSSGAVFFDQRALDTRTKVQLVIFPEIGVGVNLAFVPFVLGAHLRYQVLAFNPSPLQTYEQFPLALALSAGVRL